MRRFLLTMPLLLLSACAGDGVYSAEKVTTTVPATTPYGLFLAGEGALNDGRSSEAAAYFEKARIDADNDPLVAERAFTSALLAGDVQTAAALAPTSDQSTEAGRRMGRLVIGVEALASGKGKAAYAILSGDGVAFPHKGAAALLAPWAAAQAGGQGRPAGGLLRPDRPSLPL